MAQLRCEFNRREIAATRQRVARADRSEEFAIEILRIVFAKGAGGIGQD